MNFVLKSTRAISLLLVAFALCTTPAVIAQDGLSEAGRAFLKELSAATWTAKSSAGGVTLSARKAKFCCQGMLDCLADPKQLSDTQRGLIQNLVEVKFTEAGWFMNHEVEPATYFLGFDRGPNHLHVVMRDAAGAELHRDGMYIDSPADMLPVTSVKAEGGAVLPSFACGNIRFSYRFISRAAHDKLTAEADQCITRGRIVLHSDAATPALLATLAEELDVALATHEALLGVKKVEREFHFYLNRNSKAYVDIDQALTGGSFKENGGFAAHLTRRTYIHYYPLSGPAALAEVGIPVRVRATCIHELNHLVAFLARPGATAWPAWLAEGLAELGTYLTLKAKSETDAGDFHRYMLARWRTAYDVGAAPPLPDLMAGYMGGSFGGYYGASYLFAKRLHAQPKLMHAMLDALDGWQLTFEAAGLARDQIEIRYGAAATIYAEVCQAALKEPAGPELVSGAVDMVGGSMRLISGENTDARLLLPEVAKGPDVTLEAEFAWRNEGQKQADFYLAYDAGKNASEFVKVAVMPRRIVLFRQRQGVWKFVGYVNYETDLAVSGDKELTWHSVKIKLDSKARSLRLDTTGQRWAEFKLPEAVVVGGTRCGVGVFSSVVYFRKVSSK